MKRIAKFVVVGAWIPVLAFAAPEKQAPKDPTKSDCREVVYRRMWDTGKGRKVEIFRVMECPYKDKMAAGQCEYSWWRGMRCKE